MIQVMWVMCAYGMFCVAAFVVDPFAGAVFMGLGLVACACVAFLMHENRKLCEPPK